MKILSRLFAAAVLAVAFAAAAPAQDTEPAEGSVEWITRAFLKEKRFPDHERYYTGEMRLFGSRPTPGATYHPDKYAVELKVNEQDETSAAVSARVVDTTTNQQSDYYLFYRRVDGEWKLANTRTFMPPRGMGQMYAALAAKGKDISASDLRELKIMQTLQFNNWGMKQAFEQRREQFEEIATTLMRKGIDEVVHGSTRNPRVDKNLWQTVHDAGLNFVHLQENGLVELNAAAFGESAVGFFYAPNGTKPPPATPDDYVLVEELEPNWYLYRRQ